VIDCMDVVRLDAGLWDLTCDFAEQKRERCETKDTVQKILRNSSDLWFRGSA
jgi:hypothetical protein